MAGVVPYMNVDIEDEDSLSTKLGNTRQKGYIDIAVLRFPKISNFTDMDAFERMNEVSIRYVSKPTELKQPDMVILPGTKNTIDDLLWMRQNGLEAAVLKLASKQVPVWGICGGFQMMGEWLVDELAIESSYKGKIRGMGLFPVETEFEEAKSTYPDRGTFRGTLQVCLRELSGKKLTGYEIHMGRTTYGENAHPFTEIEDTITGKCWQEGAWSKNVCGTYVHGIFDSERNVSRLLYRRWPKRKALQISLEAQSILQRLRNSSTIFFLAEGLRKHLDMERIYRIMGIK